MPKGLGLFTPMGEIISSLNDALARQLLKKVVEA